MMNVAEMCDAFGIARSGYYRWLNKPVCEREKNDQRVLLPAIRAIFDDSRQTYGSVRIGDALKDLGILTSIRRIRRIMTYDRMVTRHTRKFRSITKRGVDTSSIPDLLDRDFSAKKANTVWVGDITEISTLGGLLYLAFILDLFSRYVVGWYLDDNKAENLVIRALVKAVEHRNPPKGFCFHSDHGSQYGSHLFQSILKFHGGKPSMGSVGDCYDNAVSESFVHTLKTECLNGVELISREFTERLIFDYIEVFYNRKRKHSSLGYMSPFQYELVNRV
jgi:transposase InsO family protein